MHRNVENNSYVNPDDTYKDIIDGHLEHGFTKDDRTGTGTIATFVEQARYNLINGRSPRLTLKKMSDTPEREMLWFISGDTSIKSLRDQNIGIWNSWLIPGTAKHRPMTEEEVKKAITAQHKIKYGAEATTTFTQSPVWGSGDWGSESPAGHIENRELFYSDLASLHSYYNEISDKEPEVLIDGDIGPGGYGAQWRFWQDTQVVHSDEVDTYLSMGYASVGVAFENQSSGNGSFSGGVVMHRKVDQLKNAIELLKTNPDSRRIIISAWNPALIWKAALPPCHLYFQFISHELPLSQRVRIFNDRTELMQRDMKLEEVRTGRVMTSLVEWHFMDLERLRLAGKSDEEIHADLDTLGIKRRGLNCFLLLRSNDLGLGQPFNVAQYASLTHMVAQCVEMEPMELAWTAVDAHIYSNHVEALEEQLDISSIECIPRIRLNPKVMHIDGFTIDDITVIDYESHAPMHSKMPVAV